MPLQKMPALLLCMSSLCSEYACHASSASSAGSEEMFLQGLSNENAGHAVRVMLPCQHQDQTRVCTGKGGVMHAWRLLLQVGVIGS